ncbi:MAG: hypothetical protein HN560_12015 [Anaerolineae bacterium]|nr:hypothetical protein [Anaerolineae bacterium]MBT7601786.1 hypothetical protein [Anaerolineae bacterium]MBT7992028.1 hypothetical protein [Anaerolineae bacterium]
MKRNKVPFQIITVFIVGVFLISACQPSAAPEPQKGDEPAAVADATETPVLVTATPEVPDEPIGQIVEMRQWAVEGVASSFYTDQEWFAAEQATGEPNTEECIEISTAWGSNTFEPISTLELSYEKPVNATQIDIYQIYGWDQVTLVELVDESGEYHPVYESAPMLMDEGGCPYILTVELDTVTDYLVSGVRINVDQSGDEFVWNLIDAVELIGEYFTTEEEIAAAAIAMPQELPSDALLSEFSLPTQAINLANADQVTELSRVGENVRVTDAWSDSGQYAGLATKTGAFVFDSVTGEALFYKKHDRMRAIAFSHDEQFFAVGTKYHMYIYSLPAGEEVAKIDLKFTYSEGEGDAAQQAELDFVLGALAFHIDTGNLVVYGEPIQHRELDGLLIFNHYAPQTGALAFEAQVTSSMGKMSPVGSLLQMATDGRHLIRAPFGTPPIEIYDTNGIQTGMGMMPGIGMLSQNFQTIAGDYIVDSINEQYQVYRVDGSTIGTLEKPADWVFGNVYIAQNAEAIYLFEGASRQLYKYSLPDLALVEVMPIWGNNVRSFSPDLSRSMNLVGWQINDPADDGAVIVDVTMGIIPQAVALSSDKSYLGILGLNAYTPGALRIVHI